MAMNWCEQRHAINHGNRAHLQVLCTFLRFHLKYDKVPEMPFHGGNTGSNPVGDANFSLYPPRSQAILLLRIPNQRVVGGSIHPSAQNNARFLAREMAIFVLQLTIHENVPHPF